MEYNVIQIIQLFNEYEKEYLLINITEGTSFNHYYMQIFFLVHWITYVFGWYYFFLREYLVDTIINHVHQLFNKFKKKKNIWL